MSTLLTAILTNHLGWVATVAPIINSSASGDQVITIHQNQATMSEISKFHPYNVLWAQLGDLYGSIGNPSRLAKTIVCGAHTVTVNKVLSVLTYFVRCGEIQRVNSTKVLDKNEIAEIISSKGQRRKVSALNKKNTSDSTEHQTKGLSRSKTCLKDISTVCHEQSAYMQDSSYELQLNAPNVILPKRQPALANAVQNGHAIKTSSTIKLMVTSPNNDRFEYETASEAIDFILRKIESTKDTDEQASEVSKTSSADHSENQSRRSLWSIDTVKEGICIDNWKPATIDETDPVLIKNIELKRSHSLKTKSNTMNCLRRSKTFREVKSNQGANAYPLYFNADGNKNIKTSLAQQDDFRNNAQYINKAVKSAANVVFVLGDNEVLRGLKTPPPSPVPSQEKPHECAASKRYDEQFKTNLKSLGNLSDSHISTSSHAITATGSNSTQEKKKKHCTHKKHSGVKFNFEQYPQIVTNYMKNKNLDITSYDFLEKGLKLEQESVFNSGATSTSFLPMLAPDETQEPDEPQEEEQCECCANTFRILQTPSNATELEFSSDDAYPVPSVKPTTDKLDTVIEHDSAIEHESESKCRHSSHIEDMDKSGNKNGKIECHHGEHSKQSSIAKSKDCLEIITLPIPKTEIINDKQSNCRIRPGYVPSLFVGITDHFIPDMVMQVIIESNLLFIPLF